MNQLLENNLAIQNDLGANFSYILRESDMFLPTEYKVLQSQASQNFVRCMKMLYNGEIQLLYLTDNLKAFSSMLPTLDPESFWKICANLISGIIDVKQNGFLSCQNIDVSFDKIFINPTNYKVSLVYVPVSSRLYEDYTAFENEVRSGLVKLITGISAISSPKTMQLAADLANGMLTMEGLNTKIKEGKSFVEKPPVWETPKPVKRIMRLVALNAPANVTIEITKDHFVIGKNAAAVDGVLSFNQAISRMHCRIDKASDGYTITDLQSANGTFVNKTRLLPNQPVPIGDGDVIKLANSKFQVQW